MRALLLTAAAIAAGCTGVATTIDTGYDLEAVTTYAWKEPPRVVGPAEPDEQQDVVRHIQKRTDYLLQRRGLRQVEKADAQVVITATMRVDVAVQHNDPQFAIYVAEEYEQATLRIEVFDRLERQQVWSGERGDRLRFVSRALGGTTTHFAPIDSAREWHVEAMVQRVLAALPLREPPPEPDAR